MNKRIKKKRFKKLYNLPFSLHSYLLYDKLYDRMISILKMEASISKEDCKFFNDITTAICETVDSTPKEYVEVMCNPNSDEKTVKQLSEEYLVNLQKNFEQIRIPFNSFKEESDNE